MYRPGPQGCQKAYLVFKKIYTFHPDKKALTMSKFSKVSDLRKKGGSSLPFSSLGEISLSF